MTTTKLWKLTVVLDYYEAMEITVLLTYHGHIRLLDHRHELFQFEAVMGLTNLLASDLLHSF